jgi:hypothetical protein
MILIRANFLSGSMLPNRASFSLHFVSCKFFCCQSYVLQLFISLREFDIPVRASLASSMSSYKAPIWMPATADPSDAVSLASASLYEM